MDYLFQSIKILQDFDEHFSEALYDVWRYQFAF